MVVRRSIAHKRRRNCSKSVCDSKLLLSDISHVFKKNYTSSCAGITHILYIFIKANTSTRLARLTSEQRLAMRAREHPHEKTPFLRQDTPTIYGIFCEAVVSSQQLFDDYAVNTCSELYKIL